MAQYKKIVILFLSLILSNCATYKKQVVPDNTAVEVLKNQEVLHTFYLIGDAGDESNESKSKTLQTLSNTIATASKNNTLLFLGDNIYPNGMPKKEGATRKIAEEHLDVQINSVKNYLGKTIFIPGNHDWYSDGNIGLNRQQKYIEEKLGKNSFLPKKGNPIETLNINDDIVLIIVDSEWFITDWNKYPTINEDSEIRTKNQFLEEFRNEIKKARGKTTLVAIHHPMFSNGVHGGKYSLESNFKPLPIIGFLKNILRKTTGISNADMQNYHYNQLKKNLVAAARQNDKVIFVSGHEHNLQFIKEQNSIQIVSGSGSKISPTRTTAKGCYSNSINGFAVLEVYKNGSSTVKYINGVSNEIDFQTNVLQPDTIRKEYDFTSKFPETFSASIYSKEETTKSNFYKFLWGNRFRKYYSTPVAAKTLNLDTIFGGLMPIRKGGGTQSKALRLKDKNGKQYVIRALRKNASQYIQAAMFKDQFVEPQFQKTASENLIKDVFTGSYPYIPLVTATLSDAIGIYHLNPKLFYIPKQKALSDFNDEFGDELYFLEEHPSTDHLNFVADNFSGKVISTSEMLQEIQSKNSVKVDESNYIKARLFDMLIGDWDRHQDQWRWLEFKENNKIIYKPLPRDRDQAFSRMSDGLILGAATRLIPAAKLLKKYDNDLENVTGFNLEPYSLDLALMNSNNKTIWDEQVKNIQNNITDEVIDAAFKQIPAEVNDETILEIKNTLKQRRKNLQKIADKYFKVISKFVILKATDKKDFIKIDCLNDGNVEVNITDSKNENKFFAHTYNPKYTKEIWIYGLGEDDSFDVKGKSNDIKIRLIGGQNNDKFNVENGKNIIVYDYKSKKNDVSNASKATIKLQDDYDINTYDFKKYINHLYQIIPNIGFNPDDGLKIGILSFFTYNGFERNPFTERHKLKAGYYYATKGYDIEYTGEFANILKKTNLLIETGLQSSNFAQNFFGLSNTTQNFDDNFGLDYNRVKIKKLYFNPGLKWRDNSNSSATIAFTYEKFEVQNTENRFIFNNIQLTNSAFKPATFFGINTNYNFENFDNEVYPTLGIKTNIILGFKQNIDSNLGFGYIIPEISFDHKLNQSGKLVLATKLKSQFNISNNFEFYQAASIGGNDGLRGFRNQRFSGNTSFYQNTDIRYSLSSMKTNLIPIKIGFFGGFDYGRVWNYNESSNKWHNSYGAGFFINGVELLNANFGVFESVEGLRVTFSLGFQF